jgi:hypothetical protein
MNIQALLDQTIATTYGDGRRQRERGCLDVTGGGFGYPKILEALVDYEDVVRRA